MRAPSSSARRGSCSSTRRQKAADCQDTVLRWHADEVIQAVQAIRMACHTRNKKSQHVVVADRRSEICLHEHSAWPHVHI